MGDNLEDKIMDKKVSFSVKDMKWVITSAVALVLWIVTAILWVKSSDAQADKISHLETQNGTLEKQVATLEGQIKGVENASTIFMQNPPSENKMRINLLERRVERLELPGYNPPIENTNSHLDTTHIGVRSH
jgi:peptidoglycan hydrolase CwlO-like protein